MKKINPAVIGHLAAACAYTIFGLNTVFCKDIANSGAISPVALFTFRAIGASILFWAISFFVPKEKVENKDYLRILLASVLGLLGPQLTFLYAIEYVTPVDSSILASITPIFTMFIAAIFLKEPITFKKASGVAVSFAGVLMLIFNSVHIGHGEVSTQPVGVLLMVLNTLCFASYLGAFKPLIAKYSVVTFMKWMFFFAMVISLPFSVWQFPHIQYSEISTKVYLEIAFLIFFATFVAYFLIPVGQKQIRPTLVSMYSYLQPFIAAIISIYIGMDTLSWQKVLAAFMVFGGVAMVTRSAKRAD